MSSSVKFVALLLSAAMFAFSSWMYLGTGDWVAAVFAIGSLGYGVFFIAFKQ